MALESEKARFSIISHLGGLDLQNPLGFARDQYQKGHFNEAFDIYEQLLRHYPGQGVQILAEVYDKFQLLPSSDRYALYQSRYHDFDIKPGERVLDIGSGDIPFKYATDLADIAIEDDKYGRAGVPFKYIAGKPVFECNVEELPFDDKEFNFVYCSHVLEHVAHPEKACDELMRVAKRGFIETPTRAKDLWLNTAKLSRHRWAVEKIKDVLIFTELTPAEIDGLQSSILLNMHVAPQTLREKAFSALIYLKADLINNMLLWQGSFGYQVRRLNQTNLSKIELESMTLGE